MKCIKKSAEGKSMLYSKKLKQGGTTQPMIQHMQKFHFELLTNQPDRKSVTTISQPIFKENWSVSMCPQSTKKINYNFVVTDKENLALFEETASFVFLKENH